VAIDPMGFVTIKGRAKRFAKVAGEMVSLAGIEALAAELWPERPSAVAAVPDPRKGERLVLFTQEKSATRATFQSFAKSRGASDVAIPAEVVLLDAIPMLGSGKIDQVAVTKLALERAKESAAA
jgi:acyl-[acyl-carrier-protein]-phospholipid O-acyltransferase/long-chain-fatty-acid--[acyl-carrier-protein] ligase